MENFLVSIQLWHSNVDKNDYKNCYTYIQKNAFVLSIILAWRKKKSVSREAGVWFVHFCAYAYARPHLRCFTHAHALALTGYRKRAL